MSDKEAQEDELLALASIYEENVFSSENDNGKRCGEFRAFPSLPQPFHIVSKSRGDERMTEKHLIEHLPPITLHFRLPPNYPSVSPPRFSLSCKWLNREQMTRLCNKLDDVWKENGNEVVLYHWITFLSTESLSYLNIDCFLDLTTVCPPKTKHLFSQSKMQVSETNGNETHQEGSSADSKADDGRSSAAEESVTRKDSACHRGSSSARELRPNNASEKRREQHDDSSSSSKNHRRTQVGKFDTSHKSHRGRPRKSHGRRPNAASSQPQLAEVSGTTGADARAVQEIRSHDQLVRVLLDFDQLRKQQEFDSRFFSCKVCFEEKLGSQCLSFKPCNHVYCKECLKSYFSVKIQSGNVQNLLCPEEKCSSHALPTQVRELVSPDLYAKYDRLLLTSTLDTMADIIYCPRINCQCPVLTEAGSSMASCPSCYHVFCVFCKMAYHGISPCRLRPEERLEIVDEYLNANTTDKKLMEQRYGRQQLRQLIDNTLSEEWVHTNSKPCPKCRANIEKLDGCNKMTCWKCDAYFCWLCMVCLSKGNPYEHFNNPDSPCQGLLFQGVDFDDDDSDNDFEDEFGRFLD